MSAEIVPTVATAENLNTTDQCGENSQTWNCYLERVRGLCVGFGGATSYGLEEIEEGEVLCECCSVQRCIDDSRIRFLPFGILWAVAPKKRALCVKKGSAMDLASGRDGRSSRRSRVMSMVLLVFLCTAAAWVVLSINMTKSVRRVAENRNIQLAFFIHCEPDRATQLEDLLDAVHHPAHLYLIHMDDRVDTQVKKRMVAKVDGDYKYENVFFARPDVINPVGISAVLANLAGFTDLLTLDSSWTHVINLTPEYMPVLSPDAMDSLFQSIFEPGVSYMGIASTESTQDFSVYLKHLYFDLALGVRSGEIEKGMPRIDDPHPFYEERGFAVARADPLMVLSRDFANYIITKPFPRRLLLGFANSIWPSEIYFISVVINSSKYRQSFVPLSIFNTTVQRDEEKLIEAGLAELSLEECEDAISKGKLFLGKFFRSVHKDVLLCQRRLSNPENIEALKKTLGENHGVAVQVREALIAKGNLPSLD